MIRRFTGGLPVRAGADPAQEIGPAAPVRQISVFGSDYRGIRPELLVSEGDEVAAGQALFRDRHRPGICVTAPVSGVVQTIDIGARRRLSGLTLAAGDGAGREIETSGRGTADLLLEAGLWAGMVARPFGGVPDPDRRPDALFVTAMDSSPGAPDVGLIVEAGMADFMRGLARLPDLTEGPVFVCLAEEGPRIEAGERVRVERFAGAHPVGLAGTHMDRLFRPDRGREVWQIHAQDVIALGRLLETGRVWGRRVISLSGPSVLRPRLVEAPMGAHLGDLLDGEVREGPKLTLSGPALGGVESPALRRGHWQVTVLPRPRTPARRRPRWLPRAARPLRPAPLVPTRSLDLAFGPDIPAVPLLRALSVGDVETAERLGVRGLLEEDLSLASYAAGDGADYGALLRRILDQLEEAE